MSFSVAGALLHEQGLKKLYSSAEDFGTRTAGTRRGVLTASGDGGGGGGGVYIAEGDGEAAAMGQRWSELVAVGGVFRRAVPFSAGS